MLGGDPRSRICDSCTPTVTAELKWLLQRQAAQQIAVNLCSPHSLRYGLTASPAGLTFSIPPSVASHPGVLLHVAGAQTPLQVLAQAGELASLGSPHGGTAEGRAHTTQLLVPGGALVRPLAPVQCPPQHSDPRPPSKAQAVQLLALQQQARTHLVTLLIRWVSSIPGLADSPHASHWVLVLSTLATRIAWSLGPNQNNGDSLDIQAYHRVKAIPGGSPASPAASIQAAVASRLGDALGRTGLVTAASAAAAGPSGTAEDTPAAGAHLVQLPAASAGMPARTVPVHISSLTQLQRVMAAAWCAVKKPVPAPQRTQASQPEAAVTSSSDAWWVGQCTVTAGVVIRGNVAHKNMSREIKAPRVLLLQGGLGLENVTQGRSQLLFATNLHSQGNKYVKICVGKMLEHRPSLVMCSGEVSQDALAAFLAAGVTVIPSVNMGALKRISRCTGALLLQSVHSAASLPSDTVVGTCGAFRVVHMSVASSPAAEAAAGHSTHPAPQRSGEAASRQGSPPQQPPTRRDISLSRKKQSGVEMVSYLVLEGCRPDLLCTTLLRGGVLGVLAGKVLLLNAVQAAYAMRCESSVLYHAGASPPAWCVPPPALVAAGAPGTAEDSTSAGLSHLTTREPTAHFKALQGMFGRALLHSPPDAAAGDRQLADAAAVRHWMALCVVTPAATWWLQPTPTPATRIPVATAVPQQQGSNDAVPLYGVPAFGSGMGAEHAPATMSSGHALKALRRWTKSPRMSDGSRSIALPTALSLLGATQPDWEEAAHPPQTSQDGAQGGSRQAQSDAGTSSHGRGVAVPPRGVALRAWGLLPGPVCRALLHILQTTSASDGLTVAQQLVGMRDHTALTALEFRALPFNSPFDTTLRQFLETSWLDPRAQVRGRWFRNVRMDLIHGHARIQVTVQPLPEGLPVVSNVAAGQTDDTGLLVVGSRRGDSGLGETTAAQAAPDDASLDYSMRAGVSGQDACQLQAPPDMGIKGPLSSAAASTSLGRVLQLMLYGHAFRGAQSSQVDAMDVWQHLKEPAAHGLPPPWDPTAPPLAAHAPLLHDDMVIEGGKQRVRFSRVPIIPHSVLLRVGFGADKAWQRAQVALVLTDLLGAASNRASMQEQTVEALAHSLDVFSAFCLASKVARALQKQEQGGSTTPLPDAALAEECGVSTQDSLMVAHVARYARALANLNADALLFPTQDGDTAAAGDSHPPSSRIHTTSIGGAQEDHTGDSTPVAGSPSRELSSNSRQPAALADDLEERPSSAAPQSMTVHTQAVVPVSTGGGNAEITGASGVGTPHDKVPVLSNTNTAALLARLALQAAAVHREITEAVHAMLPRESPATPPAAAASPAAAAAAASADQAGGSQGGDAGKDLDVPEDTLEPMSLVYSWNWVTRDLERLIVACGRILVVPDVQVAGEPNPNPAASRLDMPSTPHSTASEQLDATALTVGSAAASSIFSGVSKPGSEVLHDSDPPSPKPAAVSTVYATMAGKGAVAVGTSGRSDPSGRRGTLPLAWLQVAAAPPRSDASVSSGAGAPSNSELTESSSLGKPRTLSHSASHGPAEGGGVYQPRASRSQTLAAPTGSEHAKALLQSAAAASSGQASAEPPGSGTPDAGPVHRRRQVTQMAGSAAKALGQHVRIHADGTAVHVDSLPVSTRQGQRGFFRRNNAAEDATSAGGEEGGRSGADTSFSRRIDVQFTDPSNPSIWLRHPDFPTGRFGTVVNVDPRLPGSIIAYTLCSDPYLQKLEAALGDVAVERGLTTGLSPEAEMLHGTGASPGPGLQDALRKSSAGGSPLLIALQEDHAKPQVTQDTNSIDTADTTGRLLQQGTVLHRTTAASPRRSHKAASSTNTHEVQQGTEHPGYTQTVSSMADLLRLEAASSQRASVLVTPAAGQQPPSLGAMKLQAMHLKQSQVTLTLALPPDTLRKLDSGVVGQAIPPSTSLRGHRVRTAKPSVASLWGTGGAAMRSSGGAVDASSRRRPRGGTEGGLQLHMPPPAAGYSMHLSAPGPTTSGQRPTSLSTAGSRQQLHRTSSAYSKPAISSTGPHPHAWLGGSATPRSRAGSGGITPAQQASDQRINKLQSLFARTVDVDDAVGALMDEAEAAAQAAAAVGGGSRSGSNTPSGPGGIRRLGSRTSLSQASDDGGAPLASLVDRAEGGDAMFRHHPSHSASVIAAYASPSTPMGRQDSGGARRRPRYSTLGGPRASGTSVGASGKPLLSKGSFWAAARRSSSALIPSNASRPRQRTLGSVVVTAMEHSSVSAVSITMNPTAGGGAGGATSPPLSPVPQEMPGDSDDASPLAALEEMTPKLRSRAAISRSLDRRSSRHALAPPAAPGSPTTPRRRKAPDSPTKRNMTEQHMQQALKTAQEHLAVDAERLDTFDDYGSAHTLGSGEHPMGDPNTAVFPVDEDEDAEGQVALQWMQEREVNAFGVPLSTQPPVAVQFEPSMAGTPTALDVLQSPVHVNVMTRFVDTGSTAAQPAAKDTSATYTINSYWVSQFHALREVYLGSQRAFVESLANSSKWDTSGGKSKARFWRTSDQRFVLKSVSKTEFAMFVDAAAGYFRHMAEALQSMHERARKTRGATPSAEAAQSAAFRAAAALGRGNVFDMHSGEGGGAALATTTPSQIATASAASGGALFWPWALQDDQVSTLAAERASHPDAHGKRQAGAVPAAWRIAAAGHPGSLLVKVFGVFRIEVVDDVTKTKYLRYFLVMENLWHGVRVHRNMRFDIKGKTRAQAPSKFDDTAVKAADGSKASDAASGAAAPSKSKVLLDDDFFAFTGGGPLLLPSEAHQAIADALSNDTQYLAESNIVDYSLLVGVDPERHIIVVGIIDYLRQFDLVKQVEMNIKMAASYATNAEVTIQPPRKYQERLMAAAGRCFASSPAVRGFNMLPLLPAPTVAEFPVDE